MKCRGECKSLQKKFGAQQFAQDFNRNFKER